MLGDIRRALKREVKSPSSDAQPVLSESSQQLDHLVFEIKRNCEQNRAELIRQFEYELTRVGGRFHRATNGESAFQYVEQIISDRRAKTILGCEAPVIDGIDLPNRLKENGIAFVAESESEFLRTAAVADIGVSDVDYALADTGTLVLVARKGKARSISLLPPVHIAVMKPEQVIPGLNELFPLLRCETGGRNLSSAITFITGPSRTADIELTLVVGVHGPQQLHVVLL
ncbi:MAG: lactate utilization protein [Acidobacteriota bacterium]